MEPFQADAALVVLHELLQDAERGYDRASLALASSRDEYTVGQHRYWKNGVSILRWAISRVKQKRKSRANKTRLPTVS